MFDSHTIPDLTFTKVQQKHSSWDIDYTTKKAFIELDGSN